MSKFCGKCGAQMDDSAVVCGYCGNRMAGNEPNFTPSNPEQGKAKKGKMKIIIGAGSALLVVVLAVVICFNFLGGRSYESVIDTYCKVCCTDNDAEKTLDLFPPQVFDKILYDSGKSKTKVIAAFQDEMDSYYDGKDDYMDEWSISSWEIIEEIDLSADDVKELNDDLEESYGFSVSEMKGVKVEVVIDYVQDGKSKQSTYEYRLSLIKVGKSWYIFSADLLGDLDSIYSGLCNIE